MLLRFSEVAKNQATFGSISAFYSIRAVTTLTVVDSGSPLLRVTKTSLEQKSSAKKGKELICVEKCVCV